MIEFNYELEDQIENIQTSSGLKKFLKEHEHKLAPHEWLYVCMNKNFSLDLVSDDTLDRLPWEYLCMSTELSNEQLEKYADYLNWYCVSAFQRLSWEFINKHKNELSLDILLTNNKITDSSVIEKIEDLYMKNNNMEHWEIWKNNLKATKTFRPEMKKSFQKDEPEITNKQIDKMQKDEVKRHLDEFHIRYLYHDTIAVLRNKLKDAVKKTGSKMVVIPDEVYDKFLLDRVINQNSVIKKELEEKPETSKMTKTTDYTKMSKAELKKILDSRKIRYYYHDTLAILVQKCIDSEVK